MNIHLIKSLLPALFLAAGITSYAQEVTVCWQNDAATVMVSDDILSLVKVKVSGADVSVEQDASISQEITYRLSGHSDNGSFVHKGDFKITLSLEGLQLTSQTGTAMQIKNGKRIAVVLKDGTENVLTDAENGSQKGCMIVKGHAEFEGGGMLTINGRGKHAYKGDEYVELKAGLGTLTINSTVKDGIHIDDYFEMKGGTLNITTTGGGYWDDEDSETKAPSCINTATYTLIKDGTLNLLSTGDGGKGIKCDSTFTMTGGTLTARTTGARYIYEGYNGDPTDTDNIPDSLKNAPKAVKADMGVCINGGTILLYTEQDGGEGLESKDTLTITGGDIHIEAYDDCINAAGDIRISGGDLFLNSTDNDGIDTNQSMYISGGNIITQGHYLHELGIDVNTASPKKNLFITGGTVVCIGGAQMVSYPSICEESQPALHYRGKIASATSLMLRSRGDNQEIISYNMLRDYTAEAGGTQPELCLMLCSPLIEVVGSYELINETTGRKIAYVDKVGELYSRLTNYKDDTLDKLFDSDQFTFGDVTLPYRKADCNMQPGKLPALLIYLHEAPSRGSDNAAQLTEVSVWAIYEYLTTHDTPVTLITPQCPSGQGWVGKLRKVVNELAKNYIAKGKADAERVYIAGNSIGANGTWCQISYYPDFYAAAMPVAGNPSAYEASQVANTPVRTIMGTADTVMPLSNVKAFMADVIRVGGSILLDTYEDYDHRKTCDNGYTTERLDWLFSQVRKGSTGIRGIAKDQLESGHFYDIFGRKVNQPTRGLYIHNGKKIIIQ